MAIWSSKNDPGLVAGGVARGLAEVKKAPQTSWWGSLREGFLKLIKCPEPRGRGRYAMASGHGLIFTTSRRSLVFILRVFLHA